MALDSTHKIAALICLVIGCAVLVAGSYIFYLEQSPAEISAADADSEIQKANSLATALDPGDRQMPKDYTGIIKKPMSYKADPELLSSNNPDRDNWAFNRPQPVAVSIKTITPPEVVLNLPDSFTATLDSDKKGWLLTWGFNTSVAESQKHDKLITFEIQRQRKGLSWDLDNVKIIMINDLEQRSYLDLAEIKRGVEYIYRIRALGETIKTNTWVYSDGVKYDSEISLQLSSVATKSNGEKIARMVITRKDNKPTPDGVLSFKLGDKITYWAKDQGINTKWDTGYTVLRFEDKKETREEEREKVVEIEGQIVKKKYLVTVESQVQIVVLLDNESGKESELKKYGTWLPVISDKK
ncbi:hypothetical protein ACFL54_03590 [Planctomycetota bacterium]